MSVAQDQWLPLMDYAVKKGVSLSTLRRHIKAKKILFRVEHGRYLVFDGDERSAAAQTAPAARSATAPAGASFRDLARDEAANNATHGEMRELRMRLARAQEEIAELKTLIAFYEEQMAPKKSARS